MQQSLTLSTETPELQVRSAVPGKIHCAFLPNQDSTWQQHPECWNSCYLSGCLLLQPIRKQINKQTKKRKICISDSCFHFVSAQRFTEKLSASLPALNCAAHLLLKAFSQQTLCENFSADHLLM